MNAALVTPATIRGRAALDEVRTLFDQLYLIDSDLEQFTVNNATTDAMTSFRLTDEEILGVLVDRRNVVLNKLENKGIRIAPDPVALAPVDAEAA
jgi:hypothetical protein